MDNTKNGVERLEMAQIAWVVADIHASAKFLANTLTVTGFPQPSPVRAQDLSMTYYGEVAEAEWLTTQAYSDGMFVELVQPVSGPSMFQDYLARHPHGGVQHVAYRSSIDEFERITMGLRRQGFDIISEVDHPIARMAFFDTYKTIGVATEIMGVTPEGWAAIENMKTAG